jgi:hypothetical protein
MGRNIRPSVCLSACFNIITAERNSIKFITTGWPAIKIENRNNFDANRLILTPMIKEGRIYSKEYTLYILQTLLKCYTTEEVGPEVRFILGRYSVRITDGVLPLHVSFSVVFLSPYEKFLGLCLD